MTFLEQAFTSHPRSSQAVGDLEQGGGTLA
jgi:hypothetical protein